MIAQNPLKTGHSSPFYGKSWIDFKGREATVRQTWELRISGNFDRFMKNIGRNPLSFAVGLLLAACWLFTAQTHAATPGAAVVKKVVGTATYTDAKGGGPLKEADILLQGATITTGAGSYVDLDMGVNGNALRVEADSSLTLTKLDFTRAGEVIVNTELEVKKGSAVANVVNKLSKASKYEIKTPAGVAGIRGTALRATTSRVVCIIGTVQFRTVNGQLQLVLGGSVYAAGAPAPVRATTVESSGVAAAATSCAVNSQSAATVNQVVKQFTTVIAGAAALEAGVGGASAAATDAAKAVMAQLVAAVNEAAASAPAAIRLQAQAAAAQLTQSAAAITAAAAGNGAVLGTLAAGGSEAQAVLNGNNAVNATPAPESVKKNIIADIPKVAAAPSPAGPTGSPLQQLNPNGRGPADAPIAPDGKQAPPPAPGPGPGPNNPTPAPNTTPATTTTTTFISPTVGK